MYQGRINASYLDTHSYQTDINWHLYHLEVKGNTITFFIDEQLISHTTANTYSPAEQVGLRSAYSDISVNSFQVLALS
jgi:hypothetical protein